MHKLLHYQLSTVVGIRATVTALPSRESEIYRNTPERTRRRGPPLKTCHTGMSLIEPGRARRDGVVCDTWHKPCLRTFGGINSREAVTKRHYYASGPHLCCTVVTSQMVTRSLWVGVQYQRCQGQSVVLCSPVTISPRRIVRIGYQKSSFFTARSIARRRMAR